MKKIYVLLLLATIVMSSVVVAQPIGNDRMIDVCPMIYAPVCGENGKIYSNECFAEKDGMNVVAMENCQKQTETISIERPERPEIPLEVTYRDNVDRIMIEERLSNIPTEKIPESLSDIKVISEDNEVIIQARTDAKLLGFINTRRNVNLVVDENSVVSRVPNFWDFLFRYDRTLKDVIKR